MDSKGALAAQVAAGYSDLELEPFFESSSDESGADARRARSVQSHDPVDRKVTDEEIRSDLEKIARALEQQPYRRDNSLQLRRVAAEAPEWQLLQSRAFRSLCVGCESDMDLNKPQVVQNLLENWPARSKWTQEGLLEHYPNLRVVVTRLISAGQMGKSLPVTVALASYLQYCKLHLIEFCLAAFLSVIFSLHYIHPFENRQRNGC